MTTTPPPYPGLPQPSDGASLYPVTAPGLQQHPGSPQPIGHGQPHQQPSHRQPYASAPSAPSFDRPEHFPTTVSNDGRLGWTLGLVSVFGVPGVTAVVCGTAMIIGGLMQRRKNPVARRTGRNAAIFGASLVVSTVLFFSIMGIGVALENSGSDVEPFFNAFGAWVFAPLGIWMIIIGPLVAFIMGIVGLTVPVSRKKAERILAKHAGVR